MCLVCLCNSLGICMDIETALSGLGKGLVNDEMERVYVKLQAVWASLKVLW